MHFLFRSKTRPPRTRRPNPPFPRASLLRRLSVQLRSGGKWKFSEIGRMKSPSLDIARVRGKPLARRSRVPNLGGWRIMNRAVKFSFILTCWQKFYTVILKQQTPKCKRTWLPWIWIMFPTALGPWLMEPKPEVEWFSWILYVQPHRRRRQALLVHSPFRWFGGVRVKSRKICVRTKSKPPIPFLHNDLSVV